MAEKSTQPDPLTMYVDLLRESVLDNCYGNQRNIMPWSKNEKASINDIDNGQYWPDRAYTMIGRKRLDNIRDCYLTCRNDNVVGDIIETGVWRGGAMIFATGLLKVFNDTCRKIYLADSFEGLPPPSIEYPVDVGDLHHKRSELAVGLEEVQATFKRYNLCEPNVRFVKGFFNESMPLLAKEVESLCILRLDGDMYESTIVVLEALYDKVSIGGFVIVDDWTLPGAHQAVVDFRSKRNIRDPMISIDCASAYWRKT